MPHRQSRQFIRLVAAELQYGFLHLEPVEVVLHILRSNTPECGVNPFLESVVYGIDMLNVEDSPLYVLSEVTPDDDMLQMVVQCVTLVADVPV